LALPLDAILQVFGEPHVGVLGEAIEFATKMSGDSGIADNE